MCCLLYLLYGLWIPCVLSYQLCYGTWKITKVSNYLTISGSLWQSYYLLLFLTIPSYFWSFLTISVHLCKLFQNFKLFGEWLNEWINFARYRGAFAPKNISRQFLVNLNFFNFFTITRMSAFPGCPNIFWENGNISFTELTYSDLKQAIIFLASLSFSH